MRIYSFFVTTYFLWSTGEGYQPRQLLFDALKSYVVLDAEARSDKSNSKVILINSAASYNSVVLKSGKPVVLKISTPNTNRDLESRDIFQKVADGVEGRVMCASIVIPDSQQGSESEVFFILSKIMAMYGMQRIDMPAFLFFDKGIPSLLTPVVQGFQTYEKLVDLIKSTFFQGKAL